MSAKPLAGLIECPHLNGWIEFEYAARDRISDIDTAIKREWGNALNQHHWYGSKSWAIFYDSGDGTYIAMKKNDYIPVRSPPLDAVDLPLSRDTGLAMEIASHRLGQLDVAFLRSYWEIAGNTPGEPIKHYLMRFSFERGYEVPTNREYDCRLLALIAVVGG